MNDIMERKIKKLIFRGPIDNTQIHAVRGSGSPNGRILGLSQNAHKPNTFRPILRCKWPNGQSKLTLKITYSY